MTRRRPDDHHRPGHRPTRPPTGLSTARLVAAGIIALTGLLLTFVLAARGHETTGVVALFTALVPLLIVLVGKRDRE